MHPSQIESGRPRKKKKTGSRVPFREASDFSRPRAVALALGHGLGVVSATRPPQREAFRFSQARPCATQRIADAMTPTFRRPMEDLIYETLDRRQIPTRTDFKELRDLVNNLRGQVSGSVQSVRALHSKLEEVEEQDEGEGCGEHADMRMVTRKTSDAKREQLELLDWLAQSLYIPQ